jgi:hypothetical protein
MKRLGLVLALATLLALGGQAFAQPGNQCSNEPVPAATLLLPYFEVDFVAGQGQGITTFFSINNASAVPTLAHVVLWTDWSVPTLDFDVFLTGFDVQTIDLWQIFENGRVPITADEQNDPLDTISPHDAMPAWDGSIANCGTALPLQDPAVTGIVLDRIQKGHTGLVTAFDGVCIGEDFGDGIYRGYVTIDDVLQCNLLFPGDAGYFVDGAGIGAIASNDNQLWGDWWIVVGAGAFAQGDMLVHVEAYGSVATGEWAAGDYTFYARYVAATAIDNREPLVSSWGTRYVMPGPIFTGGTDLLVWRDSRYPSIAAPLSCAGPPWLQLAQYEVIAFDEEENWTQLCDPSGDVSPPPDEEFCFPLETQRITLGPVAFPGTPVNPPYDFGWLYLNLNHDYAGVAITDVDVAQNWVVTVMNGLGVYSVGYQALPFYHACTPAPDPGTTQCIFPPCP